MDFPLQHSGQAKNRPSSATVISWPDPQAPYMPWGWNQAGEGPLGEWLIEFMEKVQRRRLNYTLSAWWFNAASDHWNNLPAADKDLVVVPVTLLAHGCPPQAIVAAYGMDECTSWGCNGGRGSIASRYTGTWSNSPANRPETCQVYPKIRWTPTGHLFTGSLCPKPVQTESR